MANGKASFNHSCLKIPVHPVSRMPSPGYERRSGEVQGRVSSSSLRATPSPARVSRINSAKASRVSSGSGPTRSRASGETLASYAKTESFRATAGIAPLLSFYESIPDYSELEHLPDREFYAKVKELREIQRAYITSILPSDQQQRKTGSNWTDGVQGVRCVLNENRGATPPVYHGPSPFGSRTGSPNWAKLAWGKFTSDPFSSDFSSATSTPCRPRSSDCKKRSSVTQPKTRKARPRSSNVVASRGHSAVTNSSSTRASSARRYRGGSGNKTCWNDPSHVILDDSLGAGYLSEGDALRSNTPLWYLSDDSDDEFLKSVVGSKGVHQQHKRPHSRGKNVAWREPQFTVPQPFQMTRREEDDRYYDQLRRELMLGDDQLSRKTPSPAHRSHDVPLSSRLPLFHGILLQQELRRERQKRRSKARLLSQVRPFSFDHEDSTRPRRFLCKLWKSSPELRDLSRIRGGAADYEFRARPMPRHLYGAEARLRHYEEDFLRTLRRRIRAEEMLRDSSLPPSMATRTIISHPLCDTYKSHREHPEYPVSIHQAHRTRRQLRSAPIHERSSGRRSRCISPYEEPLCHSGHVRSSSKRTMSPYESCAPYDSSDWRGHTSRRPLSASVHTAGSVSPIRQNLAAVLRIESCKRHAEREIALQREQQRCLEEARVRARVLRRRPAWRSMAHISARRDLALRAIARREEERSRQQDYARQMGRMMNRVMDIPTLFERQAQESLRFRIDEKHEKTEEHQSCSEVLSQKINSCLADTTKSSSNKFISSSDSHITFFRNCEIEERETQNVRSDVYDEKRDDEPEFPDKKDRTPSRLYHHSIQKKEGTAESSRRSSKDWHSNESRIHHGSLQGFHDQLAGTIPTTTTSCIESAKYHCVIREFPQREVTEGGSAAAVISHNMSRQNSAENRRHTSLHDFKTQRQHSVESVVHKSAAILPADKSRTTHQELLSEDEIEEKIVNVSDEETVIVQ